MGGERVKAMAWSPNNQKLAVCRSDRVIQLFDEKGGPRDKFQTRGADVKVHFANYSKHLYL
jgi:intraflagellar transport protein 172